MKGATTIGWQSFLFFTALTLFGCKALPPLDEQANKIQGQSLSGGTTKIGDFLDAASVTDGRIVLAYLNLTEGGVEVAVEKQVGSLDFNRELITIDGRSGYYNHIVTCAENQFHVFTYNRTHNSLYQFQGQVEEGAFTLSEPIEIAGASDDERDVGKWPSGYCDKNGVIHLAYYDATNKQLLYANNFGDNWSHIPIDIRESGAHLPAADLGRYNSLTMTSDGKIYIGTYNASLGDAYLLESTLENDMPTWNVKVLKSEGDVGQWMQIILDNHENPIAAFYDKTKGDLIVQWADQSGDFLEQRIEPDSHAGTDISLAMHGDRLHISYLLVTDGQSTFDLRHTILGRDGVDSKETIEANGLVGFFSNILIRDSAPIFAYHLSEMPRTSGENQRSQEVLIYPPR